MKKDKKKKPIMKVEFRKIENNDLEKGKRISRAFEILFRETEKIMKEENKNDYVVVDGFKDSCGLQTCFKSQKRH